MSRKHQAQKPEEDDLGSIPIEVVVDDFTVMVPVDELLNQALSPGHAYDLERYLGRLLK